MKLLSGGKEAEAEGYSRRARVSWRPDLDSCRILTLAMRGEAYLGCHGVAEKHVKSL